MARNINAVDLSEIVTSTIDSMVQAIVGQVHLNEKERLMAETAFYEAIAEAYGEKALRLLLKDPPLPAGPRPRPTTQAT